MGCLKYFEGGKRKIMLTRFLKKHGWRYIPGFLFLLVSSYITTLAPIALGHAIDYMDMDVALIDQSKVYKTSLLYYSDRGRRFYHPLYLAVLYYRKFTFFREFFTRRIIC